MTVSLRKRMSGGMYFRLAYTWAHAIDNGQDALATGATGNSAELVLNEKREGVECDGSAATAVDFSD